MSNLFGNKTGGGLFGNQNPNQGGGLFGNNQNPNQGGGLFGNNQNQNQGGGLFGNQNPNQGGGLFGNNQNQNQGGGLFGNNQNQGGGLFGNQNQNKGGGLFGNQNQNQGGGLFGNNQNQNQGGGLFNNMFNGGNINNNNNNLVNTFLQQPNFFTTVTPVIALNKNNSIKNMQLSKLPDEYQKAVLTLKLNLKNQEIKLDELQRYSQRIIELIDQSNKSVEKMGEFNGFINKKLNQYESIVNQINENFKFISEAFDQEQKNINLMEQDLGFKIDIPSKFLITYSQNLYNKTITFSQKLNDIITLIKVYYSQANDNINFDGDIMESTIAEFIKIVKSLLEENERQEKMINEMYHIIFEFARNYGENPETVRNNIIQYDSSAI